MEEGKRFFWPYSRKSYIELASLLNVRNGSMEEMREEGCLMIF
jgi:hypothetical protein